MHKPDELQIPGGESLLELQKEQCEDSIKHYFSKEKDNICIVAHGFLNKVILCTLLEQPLSNVRDYPQGNTAVNTLLKYDDKYEVININSLEHLQKQKK